MNKFLGAFAVTCIGGCVVKGAYEIGRKKGFKNGLKIGNLVARLEILGEEIGKLEKKMKKSKEDES